MSRHANSFTQLRPGAVDLFQKAFPVRHPAIRLGIRIALGNIRLDAPLPFPNAPEAALPNAFAGDVREKPLHQIEPRAGGGGKMKMEPQVFRQPCLHLSGVAPVFRTPRAGGVGG